MTYIFEADDTLLNGMLQKGNRSLFRVSASSYQEGYQPENALNTENTYYHTNYTFTNWYQVTFKDYFLLKSYTFLTRYVNNNNHPCEWKVRGSNNGAIWENIDHVETYELKGLSLRKNFAITKKIIPYKHIRITQIKSTEGDNLIFTFGALDFFGTYYQSAYFGLSKCSRKNNKYNPSSVFAFIFVSSY